MIGDERLGRVIARLRDQRGLIQEQLAEQIDVHPTTLSKYENHGRIPEGVFLRICTALDYPYDVVIALSLQVIIQDLRSKQAQDVERKDSRGDQRPSLVQMGELYDSFASEQKRLLLGILQYFGTDSELVLSALPDIEFPQRKKRARRGRKS